MDIESRMNEFEKIAEKKPVENVKERMTDFDKVDKSRNNTVSDKESTLPFGVKRYKTCPYCGEFAEIHKIVEKEAVYICKNCKKHISQQIG